MSTWLDALRLGILYPQLRRLRCEKKIIFSDCAAPVKTIFLGTPPQTCAVVATGRSKGDARDAPPSGPMAYFHCWTRIRIRTRTPIPVLCRIFSLVQIQTLIP